MKAVLPALLVCTLAPLCLAEGLPFKLAQEPIQPAGISGSLLLCGPGEPPAETAGVFLDLAKRRQAKLVVLSLDPQPAADTDPVVKQLRERLQELGAGDLETLATGGDTEWQLSGATGVWVRGGDGDAVRDWLQGENRSHARREFEQLLQRGGVVVAEWALARALGSVFLDGQEPAVGTGWFPDALLQANADDATAALSAALLKTNPHLVSYTLKPGNALLVRERRVLALGKDPLAIDFAPSPHYPPKTITVDQQDRTVDLVTMQRIARQRQQPVFPPAKPAAPKLEHGTLIIIGGGGTPRGLMNRFVELAGGKEAEIIVLPIATGESLSNEERSLSTWKALGAGKVTLIAARTPEEIDQPEHLEALKTATGIWFGGGRQWRFVDAYEGTEAAKLMHKVLERGGVIGGSSAGASIQGEYMPRGNPLGNLDIMAEGYEQGLGFLPGVAIDQHFTQRNRLKDMTSLVDRYPQLLGIGLDESTAIIVQGHIAEVVGRHQVHFYDRNNRQSTDTPDHDSVSAGGKYDLLHRKVLSPGEPAEPPAEEPKQDGQ